MTFYIPPGATPIDPSDLKVTATNRAQLDALEFDNIHKAEIKYFRTRKFKDAGWFKPSMLKKIHADMFGDIWDWGGKYRKTPILPIGVEPYQIPIMIYELSEDVVFWMENSTDITILEMAARIHHRLTFIHPFPNGNGRFSRFVSNLFLFSYRQTLPIWPQEMHRAGPNRSHYLEALRDADKGNIQSLMNFLCQLGAKDAILIK